MSASLFLFCKQVHLYHFLKIPHRSDIMYLLLTSLSIIISRFFHVATNDIISLFFMAEYYSIVYMYHIFFIYSSVDGQLGCFYVLAFVNSAAVNSGVQVFF